MSIGLHILFIYSIICFIKASVILTMKVVPNDKFIFGGERVRLATIVGFFLVSISLEFNLTVRYSGL